MSIRCLTPSSLALRVSFLCIKTHNNANHEQHRKIRTRHPEPHRRDVSRRAGLYLPGRLDRAGRQHQRRTRTKYLTENDYTTAQINNAIHALRTECDNHHRDLYGNNQAAYEKLRYGHSAKTDAGENAETVKFINWEEPEKNHQAVATKTATALHVGP